MSRWWQQLKQELRPALIVSRREVRDQFRDWRVVIPIVVLTAFFPFLMNFTVSQVLGFVEQYGAVLIAERLVPFLLMIVGFFPISVSLVISLDSFVGEKERGSIEPLLDTPLKNWQLYFGKLLSATVPPLLGSYLGMGVYLAGLFLRGIAMPEPLVIVIIFVLTSVQAVMMVSGAVVVSVQATSVRAANLLASFIIIPSALLIQVESLVMFWGRSIHILWWFIIGLVVLSFLLIRMGLSHFQREKLLGREIDVLNFRWILTTFTTAFKGKAQGLLSWYRYEVVGGIKEMRLGILAAIILAIAASLIGWLLVDRLQFSLGDASVEQLNQNLETLINLSYFGASSFGLIIFQNLRAVLLTGILGLVSFGVAGTLPLLATLAAMTYLVRMLAESGLPIPYLLTLLAPHGIFEIPALLLGTAAILHTAARIVAPSDEKGVGEVFIESSAFWLKITLGVCIPLYLIAAVIETWVTPQLALRWFGG